MATRRSAWLIVVALVAGCETAPETEPESADTTTMSAAPSPEKLQPPPFRLTVAAVGDMMLGTNFPENILPDDDGASFLSAVTPILSAADLAVGNLEGVLIDGGEPAKACSNPKACYLFRSPTRYAFWYRMAGFDALSLANNHARDFGEEGRLSSMRALRETGIAHSGLIGDFATLESRGLRIAFMAFAVTRNSNLVLDLDLARATVAGYAGTHDIVIVSFHAGAEGHDTMRLPYREEYYFGERRGDVVRFARSMVDAGADFVFGHGPHVVRAMENYKDRLIAYSLGNFATYYGISVNGVKGFAPILVVSMDEQGRFTGGKLHSTVQIRPDGPSIDPEDRALKLVRRLSAKDFGMPGIEFRKDGTMLPIERPLVRGAD